MKTELEVARDAVRSAGLEELADALEWAAAAVRHREPLIFALRSFAGWSRGERCGSCDSDESVHGRDCPTAMTLHALDPRWHETEVGRAWLEALAVGSPRPAQPQTSLEESIADNARRRAAGLSPMELSEEEWRAQFGRFVETSPEPAQPQPEDDTADE